MAQLTSTDIVYGFAMFSFTSLVALLIYIAQNALGKINKTVSKEECEARKKAEDKETEAISKKLCFHDHDEDGRVRVTYREP